jgi:hypothetical protein
MGEILTKLNDQISTIMNVNKGYLLKGENLNIFITQILANHIFIKTLILQSDLDSEKRNAIIIQLTTAERNLNKLKKGYSEDYLKMALDAYIFIRTNFFRPK